MHLGIKILRMKNLLLTIVFGLSVCSAHAQCGPTLPAKYPLGANMNGMEDYSQDRAFNDVFKSHRTMSANVNSPWQHVNPTVDANGWPTQDFGVVVMADMDSSMGGTYKLRFNGQATVTPTASGALAVQNQNYDSGTNTTTADLVYPQLTGSSNSMMLKFTNTEFSPTEGGVKNVMIMKPGLDFNAPTFSQQFLDHMARFDHIRFMDWRHTNGNTDSLWVNRRLVTHPTQTGSNGIAWEYCIELCNTLGKDMWINTPHKSDSLYVRNLAELILTTLNPELRVYVEHSNEVWNNGFIQSSYNRNAALYEVANNPNSPLDYDGNSDQYTLAQRRHGIRTMQINEIFKDVMGASAFNNRFRTVLATQLFGFYSSMQAVSIIHNQFGGIQNHVYGIAVAPYFNIGELDDANTATPQQVLDALQEDIDTKLFGEFDNQMDLYAARCRYFGVQLMCYEGGPDTFGPNNIGAKRAASRDPQMMDVCINFLNKWYAYGASGQFEWFMAGGGNWFNQYGTWSLTEHFENSPKLQAIDAIIAETPVHPTVGQMIPGVVDARRAAGFTQANASAASFTPTGWKVNEEWLLRVPVDLAGDFTLQLETACTAENQKVVISIDNVLIDTLTIPNNGSLTTFVTSPSMAVTGLNEGLHTLRVKYVVGNPNFKFGDFTFTRTEACVNTVGIEEETGKDGLMLFPNPAYSSLSVRGVDPTQAYQVFDMTGRCVQSGIIGNGTISVEQLPAAIYSIRLDAERSARFVKQ
jgi:hypothetical protein